MMPAGKLGKIDQVTVEVVHKAIMGAHIANNGELYASYYGIPQECQDALDIISDNYTKFEKLLRDRLATLPLIEKFFGRLIRARSEQGGFLSSPLASAVFDDQQRLEHRLKNVQNTVAFQTMFQEIGNVTDPDELDRRVLDAWAEIRTIDQLLRERFIDISKVRTPADLVARYMSQLYAIQVTRISREPRFPDLPTGNLQQIYDKVQIPIGLYFWPSVEKKNLQLKNVSPLEYVRRIVIVTSIGHLRDLLNRHIACQQIRDSILALEKRHFEEIHWLPDLGNGAIFWMETSNEEVKVRCLADWRDDPTDSHRSDRENCYWREVDLDSTIPAYVDGQS
jgi:hypothetical protein